MRLSIYEKLIGDKSIIPRGRSPQKFTGENTSLSRAFSLADRICVHRHKSLQATFYFETQFSAQTFSLTESKIIRGITLTGVLASRLYVTATKTQTCATFLHALAARVGVDLYPCYSAEDSYLFHKNINIWYGYTQYAD